MRIKAIVAVLLAVAVGGCSSSGAPTAPGATRGAPGTMVPFTVTGSVLLGPHLTNRLTNRQGSPCATPGNQKVFPTPSKWDDVRKGDQVVIANAAGRTVAVTTLGGGHTTTPVLGGKGFPPCEYRFTAKAVPPSTFYKVTVGKRSATFTFDQMQGNPVVKVNG